MQCVVTSIQIVKCTSLISLICDCASCSCGILILIPDSDTAVLLHGHLLSLDFQSLDGCPRLHLQDRCHHHHHHHHHHHRHLMIIYCRLFKSTSEPSYSDLAVSEKGELRSNQQISYKVMTICSGFIIVNQCTT